jgi:AraC-like DNA-binding protein
VVQRDLVPNFWLRNLRCSALVDAQAFDVALFQTGLGLQDLEQAGNLIPVQAEIDVIASLAAESGDPALPVKLAQSVETRTGSILSYIAFSSAIVAEALENLARFSRLVRPRRLVSVHATATELEFRIEYSEVISRAAQAHLMFAITVVIQTLRKATGRHLRPKRVMLPLPLERTGAVLSEALGCPCEEVEQGPAIVFGAEVLQLPILSSDAALLERLTDYGRRLLAARRPAPKSLREEIYAFLMRRMTGGVPTLAEVAHELGLSKRTLSRRLAEEGTSFRNVVDATRASMADALIDDLSLSLTEISFLLGFADQSSFTHAYRRWKGHSPKVMREKMPT